VPRSVDSLRERRRERQVAFIHQAFGDEHTKIGRPEGNSGSIRLFGDEHTKIGRPEGNSGSIRLFGDEHTKIDKRATAVAPQTSLFGHENTKIGKRATAVAPACLVTKTRKSARGQQQ